MPPSRPTPRPRFITDESTLPIQPIGAGEIHGVSRISTTNGGAERRPFCIRQYTGIFFNELSFIDAKEVFDEAAQAEPGAKHLTQNGIVIMIGAPQRSLPQAAPTLELTVEGERIGAGD